MVAAARPMKELGTMRAMTVMTSTWAMSASIGFSAIPGEITLPQVPR